MGGWPGAGGGALRAVFYCFFSVSRSFVLFLFLCVSRPLESVG